MLCYIVSDRPVQSDGVVDSGTPMIQTSVCVDGKHLPGEIDHAPKLPGADSLRRDFILLNRAGWPRAALAGVEGHPRDQSFASQCWPVRPDEGIRQTPLPRRASSMDQALPWLSGHIRLLFAGSHNIRRTASPCSGRYLT
jgi:hypothetical protein